MKRLFVSQPMRGKTDDEILSERNRIIIKAQEALGEAMSPVQSYYSGIWQEEKHSAVRCLAYSLSKLADADVAAFGKGWEDARGCRIEHQACIDYGIDILELNSD